MFYFFFFFFNIDQRFGVEDPGKTRWSSRCGQIKKQLQCRAVLETIPTDIEYNQYLDADVEKIILDPNYWIQIDYLGKFINQIKISIKLVEANVGAGVVYFSYLRLYKIISKNINHYQNISEYDDTVEIDIDDICGGLNAADAKRYTFWIFAEKSLIKRWKLSFSHTWMLAYFTDIRFVNNKEYLPDYGISQLYQSIYHQLKNSSPNVRLQVRNQLVKFKNKTGIVILYFSNFNLFVFFLVNMQVYMVKS